MPASPKAEPARAETAAPKAASPDRTARLGNLAAGFTAVCALAVSAYTAYLQRQQVKAQVWPVLSWDYDSYQMPEDSKFSFILKNGGVGPAIVRSVEVKVDGHPVRRWRDVLALVSPPADPAKPEQVSLTIGDMHGRVVAAGERVTTFSPHNLPDARRLAADAGRVGVSICYCSVLDDCWFIEGAGDRFSEPRPLDACPRPAVPFEN